MTVNSLCLNETITSNTNTLQNSGNFEFSDKELTFKVFKSIDDCKEYWPVIRCEDPFYSPEYFRILESDSFQSALPLYAFVFLKDEDVPMGMYFLQKKKLHLSDSIDVDKFKEGTGFWSSLKHKLQQFFFPLVHFDLMIVGNILLTGKYGFRGCSENKIQLGDYQVLKRLLKNLKSKVSKTEYKFRGTLIKDFFDEEKLPSKSGIGFAEMQFDPSMILNIRPDWNSMDDYLLDMKSKHRVRIKKHLKNAATLEIRTLSNTEIHELEEELFELYDSVIRASGFNMGTVKKGYFTRMSDSFPDQFSIKGIYHEGEMVGFFSYMTKNGALLSHFIGYNESKNRDYSIYMNILLGLIKVAIDTKSKELYYYRTALEIKSSVGAEPWDMYCYLTHNNGLINLFLDFVIKTFFPVPVWTPRSPFKT